MGYTRRAPKKVLRLRTGAPTAELHGHVVAYSAAMASGVNRLDSEEWQGGQYAGPASCPTYPVPERRIAAGSRDQANQGVRTVNTLRNIVLRDVFYNET